MWMNQMKKIFLLIMIISISYSCTRDEKLTDPVPKGMEDELLALVYSNYKWPKDFYTEEISSGNIYYENTVSTKPINQRDGRWIELSSDDMNTAKQWSESSAKYSSYYRDLVSERETDKYYEFRRVYSANPSDILLSRVHKSSYIDRTMYDFSNPQTMIGKFNKTGITKNDVKELIEYLWFVWHYDNGSSKVHYTEITENRNEYIYNLYEIGISLGDWGMKDAIRYIKNTYSINKDSGEIIQQKEILKEFSGKAR
jgi:hypothetical protein